MSEETKVSIARARQGSEAKKRNARDLLLSKKPRTKTITVKFDDEEIEMTFRALSSHEMDDLTAKHPPTAEQKVSGLIFNPQTFAPALVHACLVDPDLDLEEVKSMWVSEAWSAGELDSLFTTASNLCMSGLNIPFTESV